MGKSKRKARKVNILLVILYIILIIGLIGVTTLNIFKIRDEMIKEKKLKDEITTLNKEYSKQKETNEELVKEKEKINNIDSDIENLKKEVFATAVKVEEKIKNGETDKKIAYITFDDGPYYLTDSVLSLLKEYKIKATFFTIGLDKETCYDNRSASCSDTYTRIVSNGHTIANHTYSHSIFGGLYSSPSEFIRQVKLQEELIYNKTGVKTNILRFPGGIATSRALGGNGATQMINDLRANGYGWVDWTASDGDGGSVASRDDAWNRFIYSIDSNIEVVLFHDYSTITYSILPDVIKYLEDRGYILLPLFYESSVINK